MPAQSRFALVSRRAVLNGAGVAAVLGLAACTDDRTVLGSGNRSTTPPAGSGQPKPSDVAAGPATPAPAGGRPPSSASAGPSTAAVTIAFTYQATTEAGPGGGRGGGPIRNPFIVVWIEDNAGRLVKTVSLWHLQHSVGWLNELRRWYQASGGEDTPSSATRPAGSYRVAWDLTDLTGAKVTATSVYVCVEAAREHGPYSIVRQQVSLDTAGTVSLAGQGELTGVTVTVAG